MKQKAIKEVKSLPDLWDFLNEQYGWSKLSIADRIDLCVLLSANAVSNVDRWVSVWPHKAVSKLDVLDRIKEHYRKRNEPAYWAAVGASSLEKHRIGLGGADWLGWASDCCETCVRRLACV